MWSRVDDNIPQHPKFVKAGAVASWLWICGNCYSNRYLTDGFVPFEVVPTLAKIPNVRSYADKLVAVGLWETAKGGFQVHDFHDHNPRASEVKAKREQDKARKRVHDDSRRNPRGIQTESERTPQGIQTESERIPAVPARAIPSQSHPSPIPLKNMYTVGENGKTREYSPDEAWELFKSTYPAKRRSSGFMANQRFVGACEHVGFGILLKALEQHKLSEDWKKGMIPGLEKWLERELWIQEPEDPQSTTRAAADAHYQEIQRRKTETR